MSVANPYRIIDQTLSSPFGDAPIADILRAHGTRLCGAPLPPTYTRGRSRECFRNAWHLTLSRQLEYWEGWAWDPKIGAMPFHHAWCVDGMNGAVVDPTWARPETCVYLGLHIPTDVLLKAINETEKWGVLDIGDGTTAETVLEYLGRAWPAQHPDIRQQLELAR